MFVAGHYREDRAVWARTWEHYPSFLEVPVRVCIWDTHIVFWIIYTHHQFSAMEGRSCAMGLYHNMAYILTAPPRVAIREKGWGLKPSLVPWAPPMTTRKLPGTPTCIPMWRYVRCRCMSGGGNRSNTSYLNYSSPPVDSKIQISGSRELTVSTYRNGTATESHWFVGGKRRLNLGSLGDGYGKPLISGEKNI